MWNQRASTAKVAPLFSQLTQRRTFCLILNSPNSPDAIAITWYYLLNSASSPSTFLLCELLLDSLAWTMLVSKLASLLPSGSALT